LERVGLFQKTDWHTAKADPSIKKLRAFMATLPADLPEIHSYTPQAIVDEGIVNPVTVARKRQMALRLWSITGALPGPSKIGETGQWLNCAA
jgi:hypothetical protein